MRSLTSATPRVKRSYYLSGPRGWVESALLAAAPPPYI